MTEHATSTVLTAKQRRYDRQLRLWAASGQQALENSNVLVINSDGPIDGKSESVSGVVGVETLKNIVLPGIGGFTIVDPATVTESDLGVNFFLEESSLGKSRAEETCRLLRELNPEVDGSYEQEVLLDPISCLSSLTSGKTILELLKREDFLPSYNLIIISAPLRNSTLQKISSTARKLNIPVIYTHSVGFYSGFSIQLPSEFPIVETHPDPASTQDLRLVNPWPELAAATAQVEKLDEMSDHEHGHVPYILLLLHYLEQWKKDHDGSPPSNYKEKTQFRDLVRAGARKNNTDGGEENYDEAVAAVLKSITQWTLGSSLRDIFEMEQCKNVKPDSDSFWICAAAIKTFYNTHNALPLPGSLPDMKAQSADYIALQNIYKDKARKDSAEVLKTVRAIEAELGSRPSTISEKEVEIFCKNAGGVRVIRGRDISHLETGAPQVIESIRNGLGNPESLVPIFIAFEAVDAMVNENQEDESSATSLDDETKWSATIQRLLNLITENDTQPLDDETRERIMKAAQEVRRAGGGELHNISSLTGGLVAQEALKVLTKQYVPLDNTCVFDGIGSRCEMFRL